MKAKVTLVKIWAVTACALTLGTIFFLFAHIVSTFKRFCNKEIGENIFQRGYMEHIIRDREDYETRVKYIYENPMRRYYGAQ